MAFSKNILEAITKMAFETFGRIPRIFPEPSRFRYTEAIKIAN